MEEPKEFIRQTLFEISEGLREANEAYKESRKISENAFLLEPGHGEMEGTGIDFDVAVTTKEEKGTKGQASLGIKVLGLGAGVESEHAKEHVSRVRFRVMIHHFIG